MFFSVRTNLQPGQRLTDMSKLATSIEVEDTSLWFSGHFPNNPVFPGIAQLKLVADLISASATDAMHLSSISRVKFRKIVKPGEKLDIEVVSGNGKNYYLFTITSGNEAVCSGKMFFTQT
jgi:3-hydroxyacyl-[acyl-carrier-protein] dehydratase